MLRRFLVLVAFAGAGCHGVLHRDSELGGQSGCPSAVSDGCMVQAPCAPASTPCREAEAPKPCPPPKLAAPPKPPETPPTTERVEQQAQIAQDVMLVPRTVYVPYVAQTPVAPVRLSGVNTIPGRLSGLIERRETEAPAPPPAAAPADQEQLREQIKQLTEKLNRCEQALRQAPPPPPCPSVPQSCPAPVVVPMPPCLGPQIPPMPPQCLPAQGAPVDQGQQQCLPDPRPAAPLPPG